MTKKIEFWDITFYFKLKRKKKLGGFRVSFRKDVFLPVDVFNDSINEALLVLKEMLDKKKVDSLKFVDIIVGESIELE